MCTEEKCGKEPSSYVWRAVRVCFKIEAKGKSVCCSAKSVCCSGKSVLQCQESVLQREECVLQQERCVLNTNRLHTNVSKKREATNSFVKTKNKAQLSIAPVSKGKKKSNDLLFQ